MSRLSLLWARETGECHPSILQRAEESQLVYQFKLSETVHFENVHTGGINSIHLDQTDKRYLLTGSSDKLIAIYDTWNFTGKTPYKIKPVATVGKPQHTNFSHKYSIACVQWYFHDNGLFTTSSTDQSLKIWDSNALRPAETYHFQHIVNNHALSPIATGHSLIAVATADSAIYLADMRTGSRTHILRGHRNSVMAVKWSPRNEYELASGSVDNTIYLWDVRHARGRLRSFDQQNDSSKKSAGSAHAGHVNGIAFTNDGLFLLSAGTDNRLRLWNTDTGCNTLTNYGRIENRSKRTVQMAFSHDSSVAFVPTDRSVVLVNVQEGSVVSKLTAHFSSPKCCEFNPYKQELYSGGQDHNILVWNSPPLPVGDVIINDVHGSPDRKRGRRAAAASETGNPHEHLMEDAWSDSDSDHDG